MKIKEIISALERYAPSQLQENYDNTGLNIGNINNSITGILITIDITPEVINEAIKTNCNLIVSHHPLIFNNIKHITGANDIEKCIILAIQNNISIYCGHTSFDSVKNGVSHKICEKLELTDLKILKNKENYFKKLAVFVPISHAEQLRKALFEAGAGNIGNYDQCSFNSTGLGSFRAGEDTTPFVGKKGTIHYEEEIKIETIFPKHLQTKIINSMLKTHPYQEVAFDIYNLENKSDFIGFGMTGIPQKNITEIEILDLLKNKFNISSIRHSKLLNKPINKIAVCGGSGASLIPNAINSGADIYITSDIKYHEYFIAENKILLVDIGHYESEQFTKEIFYDIIMKKNPNFAVRFSKIITNPIKNY